MDYLKDDPSTEKLPKGPKVKLGPVAPVAERTDAAFSLGTGHNTFRPDIYRTSEGYLN